MRVRRYGAREVALRYGGSGSGADGDTHVKLPQTPSFRLDGQRALVTGAGRGRGLAAAAALARAGAHFVLLARSADEVNAAATAIRDTGGMADALVADVLQTEEVREQIAAAGTFDILVNNAGANRPMTMQQVQPADFDAVMDLNVRAAFFVAQAVAHGLIAARKAGSLIHMGSQMGHVGARERSVYCASKCALEGMSKAFAMDLAEYGIRSNTIAPTFTESALTYPFSRIRRLSTMYWRRSSLAGLDRWKT